MRKALLLLAPLLLAGPAELPERVALFYYVDAPDAYESFARNAGSISIIAPSAYKLDENGLVWGTVDRRVIEHAARSGVKVMPLVVNPGFDQKIIHSVLVDPAKRRLAAERMLEIVKANNFYGMQFDFENLHFSDRELFNQFFAETAELFHRNGFPLSVAVVHKYTEQAGGSEYHKWLYENWRGAYDLEFLGKHADFVSIMTYSQHTRRTPPGPEASLPWARQVLEFSAARAPRAKLSLGLRLGGKHWYSRATAEDGYTTASAISYSEAMALKEQYQAEVQWDQLDKAPWFSFYFEGVRQYVFFEDARSFRYKLGLMNEFDLHGFSAWRIGSEDPAIWEALRSLVKIKKL